MESVATPFEKHSGRTSRNERPGYAVLRRGASMGITAAAMIVAAAAAALVVLGTQGSASSELLLDLGRAAQFAGLVLLPLVVIAHVEDRVTALSLTLFTASMFLPVLQRHSSGLALIGVLYWANVVLVAVLAIAVVRSTLGSARRLDDADVC
jgi:hypothetical protein